MLEARSPTLDKLQYLARLGLVNKTEVLSLSKAMQLKNSKQQLPYFYRDILFRVLDKLTDMVIGKTQMFNRARQAVREDTSDGFLLSELETYVVDTIMTVEDLMVEAGYMDAPRTKAEIKKKFPDVETDVKNKDSKELQPIKFK